MSSTAMMIGAAARRASCPVATVRYYEAIGLMPPAARRPGGHRLYDDSDVARLIFIRRCRELDMPLERVRALLAISDDGTRPCGEALDLAHEHLAAVRARVEELRELERTLAALAADCEQTCCRDSSATCTLFTALRKPAGSGAFDSLSANVRGST